MFCFDNINIRLDFYWVPGNALCWFRLPTFFYMCENCIVFVNQLLVSVCVKVNAEQTISLKITLTLKTAQFTSFIHFMTHNYSYYCKHSTFIYMFSMLNILYVLLVCLLLCMHSILSTLPTLLVPVEEKN